MAYLMLAVGLAGVIACLVYIAVHRVMGPVGVLCFGASSVLAAFAAVALRGADLGPSKPPNLTERKRRKLLAQHEVEKLYGPTRLTFNEKGVVDAGPNPRGFIDWRDIPRIGRHLPASSSTPAPSAGLLIPKRVLPDPASTLDIIQSLYRRAVPA